MTFKGYSFDTNFYPFARFLCNEGDAITTLCHKLLLAATSILVSTL